MVSRPLRHSLVNLIYKLQNEFSSVLTNTNQHYKIIVSEYLLCIVMICMYDSIPTFNTPNIFDENPAQLRVNINLANSKLAD